MTNEDLNQIRTLLHEEVRAIVREEITAAGQRLREEITASEERTTERQERAVHALTKNLSEVRAELSSRIQELVKRIELLVLLC